MSAPEITPEGVTIQTLAQIQAAYRLIVQDPAVGGPDVNVAPDSQLGAFIDALAQREATIQQLAVALISQLNPEAAQGKQWDVLAALAGVTRQGSTRSASSVGQITGTPATVVPDGRLVRNDTTGDDWRLTGGPYVIPGGGVIAASLEAVETGPLEFLNADTWTILEPVSGWSAFEATADLDPEDTGSTIESDAEGEVRRKLALIDNGNDLEAIIAAVSQVTDAAPVSGFDNEDPVNTVEGVPGGAFEIIVSGGSADAIRQAIYDHKPPGAQAYGSIVGAVETSIGGFATIGYTEVIDVDLWLRVTVVASAEYPAASGLEDSVLAAVQDLAESRAGTGKNVIPRALEGLVYDLSKDSAGNITFSQVTVEVGTSGVGPWQTTPYTITHRERADFDSTRMIGVGFP